MVPRTGDTKISWSMSVDGWARALESYPTWLFYTEQANRLVGKRELREPVLDIDSIDLVEGHITEPREQIVPEVAPPTLGNSE